MADIQQVAIWPAGLESVVERQETAFKLLDNKVPRHSLARLLWWTLGKLKVLEPYSETVTTWTYVPHEQNELHQAMMKAADDHLEKAYQGDAVFIIGGQTFSELTNAPVFRDNMKFSTGPFSIASSPYRARMFDIPIHVVPYMTGVALVPRVIIERKQ